MIEATEAEHLEPSAPEPRVPRKRTRRKSGGKLDWLRQIGTYMWIGLVDLDPPPLPRSKPLG